MSITSTFATPRHLGRRDALRLGAAGLITGASALALSETASLAADPQFDAQVAALIVTGINAERTKAGLTAMARDAGIDQVATTWSAHMASTGRLEHNPDYAAQMPRGWRRAAENIAYMSSGGTAQAVADQFVRMWMNSSGHRANILTASHNRTGVGVVTASGKIFATQNFGTY